MSQFSIEREAQKLFEQYRPQIDLLDHSLLAKVRPISSYDVYALGKQLESFEVYKSLCEADGNAGQLGRIPDIALDVLSVVYGSSILPIVASVQNIDEQSGLVYFKTVRAEDTRGNLTAGDTVLDPRVLTKTPSGYASNQLFSETVSAVTAQAAGATQQITANLASVPVMPQSIRLSIENNPNVFAVDTGAGQIIGAGITGTINYETGAMTLSVVDEVQAGNLQANYRTNLEAADDIAQVQSEFATKQIQARIYALKSTIGMLQAYSMQKRFGMIAEDETAKDLISEINAELGGDLVRCLDNASPNKAAPLTWDRIPPVNVSTFEHRMSIMDSLSILDKNIVTTAGRGVANIYVAGASACTVLQNLPGFTLITDSSQIGPHVFGTLNGKTIIRVPDQSVIPTNRIIGVYKGLSPFESACVYAPYMPLVLTSTLPAGQNPLRSQRAVAVWAGIDSLVPNFVSTLDITNVDSIVRP